MRSNDTILLENAYADILKNRILKENDKSESKLRLDWRLKEALGDEIKSAPKQNFYDAIEKNNLKEGSWYLYARSAGNDSHLLKIKIIDDGKIYFEDEQKDYTNKYIEKSENEKSRYKYEIKNYNPETNYLSTSDIYPDNIIIGPFEDEETIQKIEDYVSYLIKRSQSMPSYFDSHPNAPLD
jgi:hypothetical protein